MLETLLYSVTNNIATITFNRPNAMNSFDKQMSQELEKLTDDVRRDNSIRAVLLNGYGKLFMAGGDISFFKENISSMPGCVMPIVRALNSSIINLMQMSKPVVASVHGSVAGVGMSLMMASDLVIAARNTKFTMAYTGIGISPDGGASFNLPKLVGTKKAMEWTLLSDIFNAETAQNFGLINFVVNEEELVKETQKLVMKLAKGPTLSLANVKRLINESWHNSLESHLEKEGRAFEVCSSSQDFKEGLDSFLGKKVPEFEGK